MLTPFATSVRRAAVPERNFMTFLMILVLSVGKTEMSHRASAARHLHCITAFGLFRGLKES